MLSKLYQSYLLNLVFVLCIFQGAKAQSTIVLSGQVVDENTNAPVSYAYVVSQGREYGTMTNGNGYFAIEIPKGAKLLPFTVSHIAYHSTNILPGKPKYLIRLKPNPTLLNSVTITGLTANTIVNKMLESRKRNYASGPHVSNGFYRLTSKRESQYVHLSEAVFQIQGGAEIETKLSLTKMRAIKDEAAAHGLELGFKVKGILQFDVMRNKKLPSFLTKKGMKNHEFTVLGEQEIEGEANYVIEFDQKKDYKKAGYTGKLYINTENFALQRLEYGVSPNGIEQYKFGDAALRALMGIMGIQIGLVSDNNTVHYRKIGQHYYLNNVQTDVVLIYKSNREHFNFKLGAHADYLITSIDTTGIDSFKTEEVLSKGKLIENQNSVYDPDFWKGYAILLPEADFVKVAKQIEANNNKNNLKSQLESKIHKYPKSNTARLDSILSFYNRKNQFNGNALIVHNGIPILEKSYNSSLTNNNKSSIFRLGSISKTFTATLILQLMQEGKLDVEDPVTQYIPDYIHKTVTIAQLLSHQSGIPNFLSNPEYLKGVIEKQMPLDSIVAKFCSDPLEFEPGSSFQYTNSGYVVLALAIEKITKRSFEQNLQERIFEPLNMHHSFYGDFQNGDQVTGFLYGKEEPHYTIANVGGAGGISTTAQDLLKWSEGVQNGKIISKSVLDNAWSPKSDYVDWEGKYGYGWLLDGFKFSASKDHTIVYHPGTDFGFYSMFVLQPETNTCIILLNNTGDFPRFDLSDLILDQLNR